MTCNRLTVHGWVCTRVRWVNECDNKMSPCRERRDNVALLSIFNIVQLSVYYVMLKVLSKR